MRAHVYLKYIWESDGFAELVRQRKVGSKQLRGMTDNEISFLVTVDRAENPVLQLHI